MGPRDTSPAAKTRKCEAKSLLVMRCLRPLIFQPPSTLVAVEPRSAPVPWSGSVMPNAKPRRPSARSSTHSAFCCSTLLARAFDVPGAASGGATSNAATISFPQCGASGATLTYVAVGTALSSTGTVWHYGALNSSLAVSSGITPQFAASALTVTEA